MKKITKHTIISAILLVFSLHAQEVKKVEQLFNVQTVKVQKETQYIHTKNYGFVKEAESRVFDVAPRFNGYINKLYVDETYTEVKRGDPLLVVYSPKLSNLKDKYVDSFRYKQEQVSLDARERLELLGVSQKELDKIKRTKSYVNDVVIYAPENGYIFQKNITHHSAFKDGNILFKIVNLDEVWVEVKIPQAQIESLKKVESFDVSLKANSKTYTTSEYVLYPSFSPSQATATLRLMLKNKDHSLFPGMYATVSSKEKSASYLTLPRTAVIYKHQHYYVFLKTEFEGAYEPIEVEVTPLNSNKFIIKSGLKEGEEVVNNALFMMDSDAQINRLY